MQNFEKIKGTLVYIQVDKPGRGYKDPVTGAQGEDEWKASVVLTDEEYVDEFKEHIAKNKWKFPAIKDVRVTDFEEKYKCPVPELTEAKQKKVWVMTVKKSTKLGKEGGEVPEIYRPKVYEKAFDKKLGKDVLVDITHDQERIPANGSIGTVSLSFFTRTTGLVQVNLKNILVSDLIPYERAAQQESGSEFDDEEETAAPAKAATKAAPKIQSKVKADKFSDVSENIDDIPF